MWNVFIKPGWENTVTDMDRRFFFKKLHRVVENFGKKCFLKIWMFWNIIKTNQHLKELIIVGGQRSFAGFVCKVLSDFPVKRNPPRGSVTGQTAGLGQCQEFTFLTSSPVMLSCWSGEDWYSLLWAVSVSYQFRRQGMKPPIWGAGWLCHCVKDFQCSHFHLFYFLFNR